MSGEKFIASLDVGTTTIRCFIYDSNVQTRGSASEQTELLYPQAGYVEIDPDNLWNCIIRVINNAIKDADLQPSDISCLGMSLQRNTFITWDKSTGEYFHKLIVWRDLRANDLVRKWNSSLFLKSLHAGAHTLYLITRSKRFLAGSVIKFMNVQVTMRLAWVIENNIRLQKAIKAKTAAYGTLDSWLLWKLRQGNDVSGPMTVEHISDITHCTATGLYDPFTLGWATWAFNILNIKEEMMPKVVDSSYDFGYTHESIFGHRIKIGSAIGDQQASMWGSCCFNKGDVKLTLGTGSYMNVNSGSQCHASIHGLYPIIAWNCRDYENPQKKDLTYCIEGGSHDTGSIISWAINFGLFTDPADSSDIANSVQDSDGVYFIPAFCGLGQAKPVFWKLRRKLFRQKKAPINDHQAASGILGIQPSTENANMVRAILESIVFRVAQLYACSLKETKFMFSSIRVDGGVSNNDFICQMLSDLTGLNVERSESTELSVLGAGFLAGLNTGIWKSKDELTKLRRVKKVFHPRLQYKKVLETKMASWERAVDRFRSWYSPQELETVSSSRYNLDEV